MTKTDFPKVIDIEVSKNMSASELVDMLYSSGGFSAKKVGEAARLLHSMVKKKETTVFLSFPACIISTGTRGIIRYLVRNKLVDVIITTCGTLDHDLARVWADYYHGDFRMDDRQLHQEGINRLGNIFIPNDSYGIVLERKMQPVLQEIYDSGKREMGTREIIEEFGKRLDDTDSILYWAYRNRIPIYVPGITDGAFGSQIWLFYQNHRDFKIDLLKDEQELSDIVFEAKATGALMIGGGISKHHTIWWNQFRDGLDYAVYITTAVEYDGSLSGALVREAISWGKVREDAKFITVEGEATLILPLLIAYLNDRMADDDGLPEE